MNIKTLFISLGSSFLVVLLLLTVSIVDLSQSTQKLQLIEHDKHLMFKKVYELKQSSYTLTKYAHTYVATADTNYKDIYFHILDIRNGLAKRPAHYSSMYWEVSEPIRSERHPLRAPSSIKSDMAKLPYLPEEYKKLEKSEFNSNQLVLLEVEAFHAIEGLFKDDDGNYTINNAPNSLLAINLLSSKQYHRAKEKIMTPLDGFLSSLEIRTSEEIIVQKQKISTASYRVFSLLTICLLVFILFIVLIKIRVLSPIKHLTQAIKLFTNGGCVVNQKIAYSDEIGLMTKNFFDMKRVLNDDLQRFKFAFKATHQGWFDLNPQTGSILVSDEYARILGYSPTEFSTSMSEWKKEIHPDDLESSMLAVQECLTKGIPIEHEYRRKNKEGHWLWLHSFGQVIERDSNNKPLRLVGVKTDISIRKQHEFKENLRLQVMELLISSSPLDKILDSILSLIELEHPHLLCSVLLLDKKEKSLLFGAAPNLPDFYNQAINGVKIGHGEGSCGTVAFTHKRVIVEDIQSHPYWASFKDLAAKAKLSSCWSEPIFSSQGKLLGTFAIYQTIPSLPTDEELKLLTFISQLAAIAIERSNSNEQMLLSSRVFNNIKEGIIVTDSQGSIIDVNPAFYNISGYSREDVIGKNPSILNSGQQDPNFYNEMWSTINKKGYWQGDVWNRNKSGSLYAESLSISSLKDESGNITNYIGIASDITQQKQQQQDLTLLAHYDALTKLPNRVLFTDRFQQAIIHSNRNNTQLAVCFLDLDDFKPVNDTYGHDIGDKLLIDVANRIQAVIRMEDTISRLGGDEFALLLNNIESIGQAEHRLDRILTTLAEPYIINSHQIKITTSIGMTLYPDDNSDIDLLLRHADQAMYLAKVEGKNKQHMFNASHNQQVIDKQSKIKRIRQALSQGELQLYYQPKVNMITGELFGVEALLRWHHPENGLIYPSDFLPLIESTELEVQLGSWVINEALSQLNQWQQQGITLQVSINISSHHLLSTIFFDQLKDVLAQYPEIKSENIQLEILESSVLSDLNAINSIINQCQDILGVKFALDDFGTSYSSLTHIKDLSANTIKIDQSFIRDLLDDPNDLAIIEGIIGLANAFNCEVIAEGVETNEQGLMLMLMGCNEAQGYYVAKPISAENIIVWIQNYHPNKEWLNNAKQYSLLSLKEKKVAIFKLISSRWFNRFTNSIQLSPIDLELLPVLNGDHCPCASWIKRANQEQLFDASALKDVETNHQVLHLLANGLLLKHENGDDIQQDLAELQTTFNDINISLNNLI